MHDLSTVAAYFDELVVQHRGDDAAAVGWNTLYAQAVSFLSLTGLDGFGDDVSILDVGCGLGAMKTFLDRRGLKVRYTGFDISPKMIEGARERHPGCRFEVRDILADPPDETFDFVIASGLLSCRRVENHGQYVRDMIRAMYALCRDALAFNILSGYTFMRSPTLQRDALDLDYGWPDVTYRFCKQLTHHVVVDEASDSRRYDVKMYKRNRAALRRYLDLAPPSRHYDATVKAAIEYHTELGLFEDLRDFLVSLEPSKEVWTQLGVAYAALAQPAAADEALRRAIALDASYAEPHIVLGRMALARAELSAAIDDFARGLVANPRNAEARDELVRALIRGGRKGEARKAAARMDSGPHRDFLLALVAEDESGAEAALLRALEASPRYLEALVQLAMLYERTGRRGPALAFWRQAQEVSKVDKSIADRIVALSADTPPTP